MRIGLYAAIAAVAAFAAAAADHLSDSRGPAQSSRAETPVYANGATSLAKSDDGHFWAEAMVAADQRGARVRFMVDTGASVVALTANDALRIGVDMDALRFDAPIRTAAGDTFGARVRLARVSVGGIELQDVDAMVMSDGLAHSLLGMSFLGRLSRVEATPSSLILRR